ncbi:MAG: dNTP triphosphohydrolase [Alphaproteobacteria bacterium]|nr:dNTP triphosphohydrolase [Alphaproteobacteria bacterium]
MWRNQALAPFATLPWQTRGRLHDEPSSPSRSPFQRDRDRIIHSTAFRRLKHKTQVFVYHEGDHYRTRLTHSLEVAQIARTICRVLRLDEDLGEAVALAHDLGHTPFGHAGEEALHAAMKDHGGFDHNAQTLRILTKLEERYAEFNGLNLTWETLEGAVKHNGPLLKEGRTLSQLPAAIVEYCQDHDLELDGHAGPEAQVAALSDDIAYNNHDIDDGLRAGLFEIADLREDVLIETRRRLKDAALGSVADIRALGRPVVAFSEHMAATDRTVKAFLYKRMYEHWRLNRSHSKARRVVADLFGLLFAEPNCLPSPWRERAELAGPHARARLVADYIAGMTDRFALDEHRRLFDLYE